MSDIDLTPVLQRLDALNAQVAYLAQRQRAQEELFAELMPIAREAMAVAIDKLDALDKDGTLDFGRELLTIGRRVVEGFTADDVRQLGDAVVGILQTVRALTQPEVLRIASEATAALHDADAIKPMGLFGAMRATKQEDVQKGLALLIEIMKRVGHGVNTYAEQRTKQLDQQAKLARLLGPRRNPALGIERQLPAAPATAAAAKAAPKAAARAPACAVPAKPAAVATTVDGIAYGADGHLVDAAQWTRPLGEQLAVTAGVAMTDAHWAVIDAARTDFAATKASPNIRRLTQVTGMTTKDLYTLFPKAPGRAIAKIAGLPKPAGCL